MKKSVFAQPLCVFCLLFVFLSCEEDYLEKESDKKIISKEELFDGNLEFYGFNQTNGDSIGVYTIGDYGWYIHNGGRYTYTFRVTNTPEGGYLQNILFDCDENDTCYVYLFEYDLTQSERDSILAGNKVNLEGKIVNVESLSADEVDVAARSGPCAPIFTYVDVSVSWCGCNVAEHRGGCCGCNCRRSQTTTYVYVDMSPCQGASPPLIITIGGGGGGGAGNASSNAYSSDGNYPCLSFSSESPCNGSFTTPVVVIEPPEEEEDPDDIAELNEIVNSFFIGNRIEQMVLDVNTSNTEQGSEFRTSSFGYSEYPVPPSDLGFDYTHFPVAVITSIVRMHMHHNTTNSQGGKLATVFSAEDVFGMAGFYMQKVDLGALDSENITSILVSRRGLYALRVEDPVKVAQFFDDITNPNLVNNKGVSFRRVILNSYEMNVEQKTKLQCGGTCTDQQEAALFELYFTKFFKTLDSGLNLYRGLLNGNGEYSWTQLDN